MTYLLWVSLGFWTKIDMDEIKLVIFQKKVDLIMNMYGASVFCQAVGTGYSHNSLCIRKVD